MGDPLMPRRGLAERVARASLPRLTAGIVVCAGLVATAVIPFLPGPAPDRSPKRPAPAGDEIASARDRPRDGLPAGPPAPAPQAAPSPAVDTAVPRQPDPLPAPSALSPRAQEPWEPETTGGRSPSTAPAPQAAQPTSPRPEPRETQPPDGDGALPRERAALPPQAPAAPGNWTPTPQPELREKAEFLLAKGDVASARLWLDTAAARGDAEAMFRLAETYDPTMLAEWRVVGLTSDAARARDLYAKAMAGGVGAARDRLDRLAHETAATSAVPASKAPPAPRP